MIFNTGHIRMRYAIKIEGQVIRQKSSIIYVQMTMRATKIKPIKIH